MEERTDELRAQLDELRVVTSRMAAAVTRCGRDLRYHWVSPEYAAWIGKPAEEIVGKPIVEILGAAAFEELGPRFEKVLQGQRVEYEEQVTFRNLGPRWINGVYVPTEDATGTPDGWVAVITDITRRKELEEVLLESGRRKDDFLAMLAHELRNPLAPLRSAADVLRTLCGADPQIVRVRDAVDRQVSHLTRLVDDLLDVSRITQGKIALQWEAAALAEIVQEAAEATLPAMEEHRHTLTVAVPEGDLRIVADRARILQMIVNLLNNAAKFTPQGGRVGVTARRSEAGEAVLQVTDTGMGIEEAMQTHVFEAFVQEATDLARSKGGLGVGLWLAKWIVEMHGGRIGVESAGRGRGTTFTVTLPALPPGAPVAQPAV
jgi:PAS domain S-box-containing protein